MDHNSDIEGTIFKIKRFSVHDGPGIRTAVFLKGCPLNCIWCHSPEGISSEISIWYNRNSCIACGQCVTACPNNALILVKHPEPHININRTICNVSGDCIKICPARSIQFTGYKMKVSEVVSETEKDMAFYQSSGGGITLTGGEPLFQPDFSTEILRACKKKNIHTTIETSLLCESSVVFQISDYVDLFIVDMKLFDPVQHRTYTGKSNEIIKENFRILNKSGKDLLVRIPLINNITDSDFNKNALLNFVKGFNKNIPIEFIDYNPLTENNYKKLDLPFLL